MIGTTITQFLIEEQRHISGATGDLTAVINDVVTACKAVAAAMRYGALSDDDLLGVSASENVQGEVQKTLDILANDVLLRRTEFSGNVAGMVSEEMDTVYELPAHYPKGRYLLLYDPVDGSSNVAENAAIGTIFSILKRPEGATGHPGIAEFMQPGSRQVCAGYAIYGPSTMIVLTTGNCVNGFTLDPLIGEFVLSHPRMFIPEGGSRIAVNLLREDDWEEPYRNNMRTFVKEFEQRSGHECYLRWSGGVVVDVHRIMISGGIAVHPGDKVLQRQGLPGKLRLLYEVNPLAFLIEQAGGQASDGKRRVLDVQPDSLHQRSPAIFGGHAEVSHFLSALQA